MVLKRPPQNRSSVVDDLGVIGVLGRSRTKGNGGSTSGDPSGMCGAGVETGVRGRWSTVEKRVGEDGRTNENREKSSVSSEDGGGVASLTGLCRQSFGSCFGVLLERRGCGTASWLWAAGRLSKDQHVWAGLSDIQKQQPGSVQCLRRGTCFKVACRSPRTSR